MRRSRAASAGGGRSRRRIGYRCGSRAASARGRATRRQASPHAPVRGSAGRSRSSTASRSRPSRPAADHAAPAPPSSITPVRSCWPTRSPPAPKVEPLEDIVSAVVLPPLLIGAGCGLREVGRQLAVLDQAGHELARGPKKQLDWLWSSSTAALIERRAAALSLCCELHPRSLCSGCGTLGLIRLPRCGSASLMRWRGWPARRPRDADGWAALSRSRLALSWRRPNAGRVSGDGAGLSRPLTGSTRPASVG
jgi:hypothetical protein